jgi:hypothetical protein
MRERAAMLKSRKRRKKGEPSTPGAVRMTPEMHDMLLRQREAFRKKFGRDPGPGDPFFFDPNADEPTPDPAEWTTEIPELLISGFTRKDLALVGEILHAIAPIEGRQPLKLVTRIEIAAAFLASACDCAFNSADAIGSPGDAPGLYAKTEELAQLPRALMVLHVGCRANLQASG